MVATHFLQGKRTKEIIITVLLLVNKVSAERNIFCVAHAALVRTECSSGILSVPCSLCQLTQTVVVAAKQIRIWRDDCAPNCPQFV